MLREDMEDATRCRDADANPSLTVIVAVSTGTRTVTINPALTLSLVAGLDPRNLFNILLTPTLTLSTHVGP